MAKKRIGPVCTCEKCGKQFRSWKNKPLNRWCSRECAPRGRQSKKPLTKCLNCGVWFTRYGGWAPAKYCSRACYLEQGGKRPTKQGYILVYAPEWSDRQSGQVLEHRLVMAKHLGRKLKRNETVHHINGDRADNRIENLQLRSGNHGKGHISICNECGSHDIRHEQL